MRSHACRCGAGEDPRQGAALREKPPCPGLGPKVWLILQLCPTMGPSANLPNKPACPGLSPQPTGCAWNLTCFSASSGKGGSSDIPQRQLLCSPCGDRGQEGGTCLEPSLGPWLRIPCWAPSRCSIQNPLGCGRVQRKGNLVGKAPRAVLLLSLNKRLIRLLAKNLQCWQVFPKGYFQPLPLLCSVSSHH